LNDKKKRQLLKNEDLILAKLEGSNLPVFKNLALAGFFLDFMTASFLKTNMLHRP
jgi:hypothetical protein